MKYRTAAGAKRLAQRQQPQEGKQYGGDKSPPLKVGHEARLQLQYMPIKRLGIAAHEHRPSEPNERGKKPESHDAKPAERIGRAAP